MFRASPMKQALAAVGLAVTLAACGATGTVSSQAPASSRAPATHAASSRAPASHAAPGTFWPYLPVSPARRREPWDIARWVPEAHCSSSPGSEHPWTTGHHRSSTASPIITR